MQRHRTTHNAATADREKLRFLNAFRNREDKQELIDDAAKRRPATEEGMALRRALVEAIHVGDVAVPFSRGEMDKAYVSMVAVMRFKGSPTVFLTVSPSNIDSKVALTIACRNSQNMVVESYNRRSDLVLSSPVSAALYFRLVMDAVLFGLIRAPRPSERSQKALSEMEPGIFGRCHSYSMTVECQGRSLLHGHILLWVNNSPELIQQMFRRAEPELDRIISFVESISTVEMPQDFWRQSNANWQSRTRPDHPGLLGEGMGDEARFFNNVHLHGLHRQHVTTCWKNLGRKGKGGVDEVHCRMAMPAGLWDRTEFIGVGVEKGADGKERLVYKDEAFMRAETPCTHAYGCVEETCAIGGTSQYTLVLEQRRRLLEGGSKDNSLVQGFTRPVLDLTNSNSSTGLITTQSQAMNIVLYKIKYNSKHKTLLENSLSCFKAAVARVNSADPESTTERSLFNSFLNATRSQQEVPVTMAAYALLGNYAYETNERFWYIFPHDAIGKERLDGIRAFATGAFGGEPVAERLRAQIAEEGGEDGDADSDEELLEAFFDDQPAGEESSGKLYEIAGADGGVEAVALRQHELYMHRPRCLDGLSLLEFACWYEVEELSGGNASFPGRIQFLETCPIHHFYHLRPVHVKLVLAEGDRLDTTIRPRDLVKLPARLFTSRLVVEERLKKLLVRVRVPVLPPLLRDLRPKPLGHRFPTEGACGKRPDSVQALLAYRVVREDVPKPLVCLVGVVSQKRVRGHGDGNLLLRPRCVKERVEERPLGRALRVSGVDSGDRRLETRKRVLQQRLVLGVVLYLVKHNIHRLALRRDKASGGV
jgi:hypothetical protein